MVDSYSSVLCMWSVLTLPLYTQVSDTVIQPGAVMHLAVSCRDIPASLPFYRTLGFTILFIDNETSPSFVRLTDGMVVLALIAEDFGTPALACFTTSLQENVAGLQQLHIDVQTGTDDHGDITQAHFTDPDGLHIWLHPLTKHSIQPAGEANPVCGIFGELATRVQDLDSSIRYWRHLGFTLKYRADIPYPFAIMSNGPMLFGLHRNNEITRPALTYYAPDMAGRIEKLKQNGITFVNDFPDAEGKVRNAVAQAPDGQLFFLFEGEL